MREGNFTSLRLLAQLLGDTTLVPLMEHGWEAYVRKHTDIPFLCTSKHFRQIVLGTLVC